MIEVVRSRLDARQRHRWHVALEGKPLLAERAPRARGPWLVAVASACLYVAMLVVIAGEGAFGIGDGLLGALTGGGVVLLLRTGLWLWRESRSAWPSGRYLFSWGYVEVEHDRLRYVAGAELEHELHALASDAVELRLRAGGWSTRFVASADALPAEALARIGTRQPTLVVDGYRDAPWIVDGADVGRWRLGGPTRTIASVAAAALVGAWVSPYVGVVAGVARDRPSASAGRDDIGGARTSRAPNLPHDRRDHAP